MSKKYNIILTCLFLIIQCACIEPLEISNNLNEFALVVDGKITQKDVVHKLYLSRTSNLGAFRYIHVRGAQIDLCDTEGNRESYFEDPANEYYVLLGDQLSREPGNSYYIEIKINNSLYRSTPQMMPDIIEADTLRVSVEREQTINSYGNVIENNYISLYISTPIKISAEENYFIWRADEVYSFSEIVKCHPFFHDPKICYVKRPIQNDELKIFSTEGIGEGMLRDFQVARINPYPLWEHFEKHFYNVAQHSIPREAYTYWETVKKIAQPKGSIFETPPAPIPGNIVNVDDPSDKVLGYFEVSAVDTVRTRTYYYDLEPLAVTDRCPQGMWYPYGDPPCCDCLTLEDSYVERPNYWNE